MEKKPFGTWLVSWQRGAQLPQQFVPEGNGCAFLGRVEMAEEVIQALVLVRRQLHGAGARIEIPSEHLFMPALVRIFHEAQKRMGIPPTP